MSSPGDGPSRPVQSFDVRLIVDRIPAFTWSAHADGFVEFVNQRWREYAGLSPEESQGWGWQVAIHPEDLPSLMGKWRELLRSGEPGDIEARMRRHDGVFRWFLIRFEPFRDETGKIAMWYGVSADIEDLKQTEEKLREEERELRRITDAIPQTIVVLDPSGAPMYANQATLDYTGLTAEASRGGGPGCGNSGCGVGGYRRRRRKGKTGESSPRFPAQEVTAEIPLSIPLPPIPKDGSSGMSTGMGGPSPVGISQGNDAVS